jgi:Asp-tRNA(Asn)/Glu-tRNA(Gln) amidotransferase A subunit family amidase
LSSESDDIAYLSAIELVSLFQGRDLSPVEAVLMLLDRIERVNPALNAYITVAADVAIDQARRAEEQLMAGIDLPPLIGVPFSVKDLTPTNGIRTTRGSLLWEDWVPNFNAPVVERLLDAGGVMLGKTNTPEFGWKGYSGNRIIGPTHNPWRHGLTAGGSSGGAAAAVAAGLGPLAQGSDGGGSIRLPSSFCGIVGLKPSLGLVPVYPAGPLESLSHVGPMTRTVRDAALMLSVIEGPDQRDRLSLGATTKTDYVSACDRGIDRWRVAWSPDLGHTPVSSEVREITAAAATAFCELGCEVETLNAPMLECGRTIEVILATAQAALHLDDFADVRDRLDPGRVALIEASRAVSSVELAATALHRADVYHELRELFERYDLLLTPTLPLTAFRAGDDGPSTTAVRRPMDVSWTPFTYPFNLTGHPAASIPCGWTTEGLPVGLQLVADIRQDAKLLRAAAAFESIRPWEHVRPPCNEGSHVPDRDPDSLDPPE